MFPSHFFEQRTDIDVVLSVQISVWMDVSYKVFLRFFCLTISWAPMKPPSNNEYQDNCRRHF